MTRNDSFLNTGASSQSFAPAKVSKAVQSQKRTDLLPAGDIVKAEVMKTLETLSKPDQELVLEFSYDGKPNTLEIYMASRVEAGVEVSKLWKRLENLLRDNKDNA